MEEEALSVSVAKRKKKERGETKKKFRSKRVPVLFASEKKLNIYSILGGKGGGGEGGGPPRICCGFCVCNNAFFFFFWEISRDATAAAENKNDRTTPEKGTIRSNPPKMHHESPCARAKTGHTDLRCLNGEATSRSFTAY